MKKRNLTSITSFLLSVLLTSSCGTTDIRGNSSKKNMSTVLNVDTSISTGVLRTSSDDGFRYYIGHEIFVNTPLYSETVKNARNIERQKEIDANYRNNVEQKKDENIVYSTRGSGSCVIYEDLPYILTNHHVIDINENLLGESFVDESLDVAFIPFENVDKRLNNFDLSKCLVLDDTEPTGNYAMFQGVGDMFYSAKVGREKLILNDDLHRVGFPVWYDFNEKDYPTWFTSISGSIVYTENNEMLGVITSVGYEDNFDNHDIVYFTPKDKILEFARRNIK